MADENGAQQRRPLSFNTILTFIGMIFVGIAVYYNGIVKQSNDITALRSDLDNAKRDIAQLRSDNNQLHSEFVQGNASISGSIDKVKEMVYELKTLLPKDGRAR